MFHCLTQMLKTSAPQGNTKLSKRGKLTTFKVLSVARGSGRQCLRHVESA
jgi:hypothetical protein